MGIELAAAIAICLADWGAAASHMAHNKGYTWMEPYPYPLLIFGDVWHFVAGFRYLPMALLAWLAFGLQWEWWVATALVNSIGWYLLKRLHGKIDKWGWQPRWLKSITTAWRVSHTDPPHYDHPGEDD